MSNEVQYKYTQYKNQLSHLWFVDNCENKAWRHRQQRCALLQCLHMCGEMELAGGGDESRQRVLAWPWWWCGNVTIVNLAEDGLLRITVLLPSTTTPTQRLLRPPRTVRSCTLVQRRAFNTKLGVGFPVELSKNLCQVSHCLEKGLLLL